jgi:hypothetical protein
MNNKREEQIATFASNYSNENFKGNTYEAYAEREDIFRACMDAAHWADENPKEEPLKWAKVNKGDEFTDDVLFATKSNLESGHVSNMIHGKGCHAPEDGYCISFNKIIKIQIEK